MDSSWERLGNKTAAPDLDRVNQIPSVVFPFQLVHEPLKRRQTGLGQLANRSKSEGVRQSGTPELVLFFAAPTIDDRLNAFPVDGASPDRRPERQQAEFI
jgi:hypothetical protein